MKPQQSTPDPRARGAGAVPGSTKCQVPADPEQRVSRIGWHSPPSAAIERIARAEAVAAGAPKEPAFAVIESCPATYNDPKLTARIAAALRRTFGDGNVVDVPSQMASEDFSEYGLAGVPAVQWSLGAGDPAKLKELAAAGKQPPLPPLQPLRPRPRPDDRDRRGGGGGRVDGSAGKAVRGISSPAW